MALLRASELGSSGTRAPSTDCAMVGLEYDDRTVWGEAKGGYLEVKRGGWFLVERRQLELGPALARLVSYR